MHIASRRTRSPMSKTLRATGIVALTTILSLVVVIGEVWAVPAAPERGNAVAAKACQKDKWQDLATSTGERFEGQGACTSYAARGGTLASSAPVAQWERLCEQGGAIFDVAAGDLWRCGAVPGEILHPQTIGALVDFCLGIDRFTGGHRNIDRMVVLLTCGLEPAAPF